MKRVLKYIVILAVGIVFSCQKEYVTYTDDVSGIYFKDLKVSSTTQTTIAFGLIPSSFKSDTVEMNVLLVGQVKNFDREFVFVPVEMTKDQIVYDNDSLEIDRYKPALGMRPDGMSDYKILTQKPIIPAGSNEGTVLVELFRNNLAVLEESRKITFELRENENFKFMYATNPSDVRTTSFSFVITEKVLTPWWWEGDFIGSTKVKGSDMFGDYTKEKSLMITDFFKIDRAVWTEGQMKDIGGVGKLRFYAIEFQKHLNEQKKLGNTIYEADGTTEMVMGPWTLEQF